MVTKDRIFRGLRDYSLSDSSSKTVASERASCGVIWTLAVVFTAGRASSELV